MRRSILHLIATAVIVFGLGDSSATGVESFKVIVNPDNPIHTVDRAELRELYLKKATDWSDGTACLPIDLASKFPARDRFAQDVIGKTPSQLKTYWNQQIFSGKGVPPSEAESTADVIAYVLANRGAVGYLPADIDPGKAKVVGVK